MAHEIIGLGRSTTIVAAYLMSKQKLNVDEALTLIQKARPCVQYVAHFLATGHAFTALCRPNEGFLRQLQLYHDAAHEISKDNKVRPSHCYGSK